MEDLFQVYGASTKQEVLGGIFSKVKQSQTLPAAWVFGLCHGNTENNSSLLLENISYKCARILSAKRPHICSSSHNYRSMGTGQRSQLLLQPRFKWNCGKFNEKQFACPHTLAEEEKNWCHFFHWQSFIDNAIFVRLPNVHQHCWHVRLCIHTGGVSHEHARYRIGRMLRCGEDRLYDNSICCHGE